MIKPGQPWNDTQGQPIQAHAGGVLFEAGVYYWYGMNWDGPTILPKTLPQQNYTWFFNRGITIYTSRDLYAWKPAATVLTEVSYNPASLLQPLNGLIRPKIIKNDQTGRYILMAALTAPDFESFNDIVFADADSPTGPFIFRGKLTWQGTPGPAGLWAPQWKQAAGDPPSRIRGFDMTLFKDEDGKAYLLTAHHDVFLYELAEDYLSVTRVAKLPEVEGEAPAMFKAHGTYYLLTSRLTGWAPNRNTYYTAPTIHGPWTPRGNFATGPHEETTFNSQVAYVLPVAGKPDAFIFIADRFGATSDVLVHDFQQATHIWLPIQLNPLQKSLQVTWRDSWDLGIFGIP